MREKIKKNLPMLTLFAALALACGLLSSTAALPTKTPNQLTEPALNGYTRIRLHPGDGRVVPATIVDALDRNLKDDFGKMEVGIK